MLMSPGLLQVKKLKLLVQAFETFERISLTPGNGDITIVELQVKTCLLNGVKLFAWLASSDATAALESSVNHVTMIQSG